MWRFPFFWLATAFLFAGCAAVRPPYDPAEADLPRIGREFRAVWIATVANIDWPSAPGLPVERQKAELRSLFDRAEAMHMNAIILQVRPMTDAVYFSELEPWSEYLTGEMGKPPEPFYDPLAFAIEEAHKRGMELHAWFNPFRSRHSTAFSEVSDQHVSRTNPDIVRKYGQHLWLDPGMEEAREYSVNVILDVIRRYDIDGVHIDDYFYPYREQDAEGRPIEFPDSMSYARSLEEGIEMDIDDWRRNNVDLFVERLYTEIKRVKPQVRFGISPFGIWRPGYPEQIEGFDAYQEIYADALKWWVNGWCDYFTPQLYWPIDQRAQSYPVLLKWWHDQNVTNRHLWPGNFTSRITGEDTGWPVEEILRQVEHTRMQSGAEGNVHFSMRVFMRNPDNLAGRLAGGPYNEPALIPASPWLGEQSVSKPELSLIHAGDRYFAAINPARDETVWLWVVRCLYGSKWKTEIHPGWKHSVTVGAGSGRGKLRAVAVTAVDRLGFESEAVIAIPDR